MIRNTFIIDSKEIGIASFEKMTIGGKYARLFYLTGLFLLIITIMRNKEPMMKYYALGLVVFYSISLILPYIKAVAYAKKYGKSMLKFDYIIQDNTIKQTIEKEKKTVSEKEYKFNNKTKIVEGYKYIFIYTENKHVVTMKKNAFNEGDIASLRAIVNQKNDVINNKFNKSLKLQKIFLIIGIVGSIVLSFVYFKDLEVSFSFSIFIRMLLCFTILALWISFAITFFVRWYKEKDKKWKVLSVCLFPITIFCFMLVGFVMAIPYSLSSLQNR